MLFGRTSANRPSRFTGEIPPELLEMSGRSYLDRDGGGWTEDFDRRPREVQRGGFGNPAVAFRRADGPARTGRTAPPAGGRPASAHRPIAQRPSSGYTAPAAPANLPEFRKGDMVEHTAFGKGMVLSVQKMGGDALLEIAFDNVGTKRLMLKSAAAHMQKV